MLIKIVQNLSTHVFMYFFWRRIRRPGGGGGEGIGDEQVSDVAYFERIGCFEDGILV